MMIKQVCQDESLQFLREGRLARLGCIAGDEPYIVPVNYVYDGECAYFHSLPGHKIASMRLKPFVCMQVDNIENELSWTSVLAFGAYEEITNSEERSWILSQLMSRFPPLTPVESFIAAGAD